MATKMSPKWIAITIGIIALIVAGIGKYVFQAPDTNPVEAAAEKIVKDDLGIDLSTPKVDNQIPADNTKPAGTVTIN